MFRRLYRLNSGFEFGGSEDLNLDRFVFCSLLRPGRSSTAVVTPPSRFVSALSLFLAMIPMPCDLFVYASNLRYEFHR